MTKELLTTQNEVDTKIISPQTPPSNTIFIVTEDFSLNNQTVSFGAGCLLIFDGGSFKNGTIEGPIAVSAGIYLSCCPSFSCIHKHSPFFFNRAFACFSYRGPNYPASLTYCLGGSLDTQSSCTQPSELIPTRTFFSLPEALYDFLLVRDWIWSNRLSQLNILHLVSTSSSLN